MEKSKRSQPRWIVNLRSLMTARGFNPRSLSLKAGLNSTAVRDMLEGRTRFPRYDTVEALAQALDVTPAQLMGGAMASPQSAKNADLEGENLNLLTEIIARLHEVAQEYRRDLDPQEFAAIVTTIYKRVKSDPRKPAKTSLKPKICDLLEYENVRRSRRR